MISDQYRCIFVHIPKTAGSSIENAIWGDDLSNRNESHLWMGAVRPGFNKYQSGGLQHLLAHQIRLEVGAQRFEDYYKFALVRNPWDKVVSQFLYLKTRPDLLRFMQLHKWCSFRSYVAAIAKDPNLHIQSTEQHLFVNDTDGERLVDFVGCFEQLPADFATVSQRLGMQTSVLPHKRKSGRRKPYQKYYNSRTRDMVATVYKTDIEVFGYAFE